MIQFKAPDRPNGLFIFLLLTCTSFILSFLASADVGGSECHGRIDIYIDGASTGTCVLFNVLYYVLY